MAVLAEFRDEDGADGGGFEPWGWTGETCAFCGGPEVVDLHEVWEGHEFMFETCCEGLHEAVVQEMNANPAFAAELLRRLGAEEVVGRPLRRVAGGGGSFLLDCELDVRPVPQGAAREFIRRHHEHCPPPAGWRFGASVWNGWTMLGVVWVGRPVARRICQRTVVEVNRLCVRRDLPEELRWKACSTLYGWAADEARRRGFARIITYTLENESGMSLRYARWKPELRSRGGSWDREDRPRADRSPTCPKVRWGRTLAA